MILAIESSCDESALALFEPTAGLRREVISSQAEAHVRFGGVVPELASRMHLSALPLLLADYRSELAAVSTIAVTRGPGLLPCLSMGVSLARALALATGKPLVGVNHLRGHVHSPFDKGAKLLGLPYPGGALIEQHATRGDVRKYVFPRGIPEKADLRMSFSGLKTALRYQLEKMSDAELAADLPDLCAGYQHAIIEQLVAKAGAALDRGVYRSVGLSGGVANNRTLRQRLTNVALQRGLPMLIAEPKHCGDNAGMIAFAAWADRDLPTGTAAAPAPSLTVEET